MSSDNEQAEWTIECEIGDKRRRFMVTRDALIDSPKTVLALIEDKTRRGNLGYAPRGRTRWERACRHWHHGRLMRYPRLSVLAFIARDLRRPITDRETT